MAIVLDGSNANTVGIPNLGTPVASTSGTNIDYTGIPSGVKRITVMLNGFSTSGTSLPRIQLGTGGVPTTSGYVGTYINLVNAVAPANLSGGGADIANNASAGAFIQGICTFALLSSSSNIWTFTLLTGNSAIAQLGYTAGSVTLSGVLNMVRITTVNGTDTFDAGSVNIQYE